MKTNKVVNIYEYRNGVRVEDTKDYYDYTKASVSIRGDRIKIRGVIGDKRSSLVFYRTYHLSDGWVINIQHSNKIEVIPLELTDATYRHVVYKENKE